MEDCCVCLEPTSDKIECNHYICLVCLMLLASNNHDKCPICRAKIGEQPKPKPYVYVENLDLDLDHLLGTHVTYGFGGSQTYRRNHQHGFAEILITKGHLKNIKKIDKDKRDMSDFEWKLVYHNGKENVYPVRRQQGKIYGFCSKLNAQYKRRELSLSDEQKDIMRKYGIYTKH